jgi:DNA-binding XRE family transcriptional regulator
MSVQIIKHDGKPEYAVLPYAEYLELVERLEDKEDLADVVTYRESGEETYPDSVVEALLIGENPIRIFRRHREMTQNELATGIQKSKAYVAKLESGERKGTTAVIRDIAAALTVDIDQLI